MALNPGNKETLVNERTATSLVEEKKWACHVRVYDNAGRKQAFIKHLLYATYITLATVFNFLQPEKISGSLFDLQKRKPENAGSHLPKVI